MLSLHDYILHTIRPSCIRAICGKLDTTDVELTDHQIFNCIFSNYRKTSTRHIGLRLTYLGCTLMKRHFAEYKYAITTAPSNQSLIMLDKKMEWPYYIGKTSISFFNEIDASWFKLTGSDIIKFSEDL